MDGFFPSWTRAGKMERKVALSQKRASDKASAEAAADWKALQDFVGGSQLQALRDYCRGEEGNYFRDKLREYGERISTMPKTYEKDGQGDAAIVHLHYFVGGCDWWIIERDSDPDGEGQIQAFGIADLGHGGELGYINIPEILKHGAELDLHFAPIQKGTLFAAAG